MKRSTRRAGASKKNARRAPGPSGAARRISLAEEEKTPVERLLRGELGALLHPGFDEFFLSDPHRGWWWAAVEKCSRVVIREIQRRTPERSATIWLEGASEYDSKQIAMVALRKARDVMARYPGVRPDLARPLAVMARHSLDPPPSVQERLYWADYEALADPELALDLLARPWGTLDAGWWLGAIYCLQRIVLEVAPGCRAERRRLADLVLRWANAQLEVSFPGYTPRVGVYDDQAHPIRYGNREQIQRAVADLMDSPARCSSEFRARALLALAQQMRELSPVGCERALFAIERLSQLLPSPGCSERVVPEVLVAPPGSFPERPPRLPHGLKAPMRKRAAPLPER